MSPNRTLIVGAGVALWLPLLFSFLGALRVPRLPGMAESQVLMVALLVAATLLLGMLIGRAACLSEWPR
jgi:hypothetical protein